MPSGFFQLPNVPYLIASFAHVLGLAVWLGGIVALGAIAAPVLFRQLPRAEAGALFGPMLRVFERLSVGAAIATVGGAAAKSWLGQQNLNVWVVARFAALAGMLLLLAGANLVVHPRIRKLQAEGLPSRPEGSPERDRFQSAHKLSERMMMGQLWLGLVVLLLA